VKTAGASGCAGSREKVSCAGGWRRFSAIILGGVPTVGQCKCTERGEDGEANIAPARKVEKTNFSDAETL